MSRFNLTENKRIDNFSGSLGAGPYTTSFGVVEVTDIQVFLNDALLPTSSYSASRNTTTGSVAVTITTVSAATIGLTDTISIVGKKSLTPPSSFTDGSPMGAAGFNDKFDDAAIVQQETKTEVSLAIKAPPSEAVGPDLTLPNKNDRKGKTLTFNAVTGAPETTYGAIDPAIFTAVDNNKTNINIVAGHTAALSSVIQNITAIQGAAANAVTAAADAATTTAARTAAQAALTSFNSIYLGAHASHPTVDNNGDPLSAGAMYLRTGTGAASITGAVYIYDGSGWVPIANAAHIVYFRHIFEVVDRLQIRRFTNSTTTVYTTNFPVEASYSGFVVKIDGFVTTDFSAVRDASTGRVTITLLRAPLARETITLEEPTVLGVGQRYGPATVLTGVDINNTALQYRISHTEVHVNGVLLQPVKDYTATTGNSITLTKALHGYSNGYDAFSRGIGDIVDVRTYNVFLVADTVPASTGGTFGGRISAPGFTTTGDIVATSGPAGTQTAYFDAINGNLGLAGPGTPSFFPNERIEMRSIRSLPEKIQATNIGQGGDYTTDFTILDVNAKGYSANASAGISVCGIKLNRKSKDNGSSSYGQVQIYYRDSKGSTKVAFDTDNLFDRPMVAINSSSTPFTDITIPIGATIVSNTALYRSLLGISSSGTAPRVIGENITGVTIGVTSITPPATSPLNQSINFGFAYGISGIYKIELPLIGSNRVNLTTTGGNDPDGNSAANLLIGRNNQSSTIIVNKSYGQVGTIFLENIKSEATYPQTARIYSTNASIIITKIG